jgi:hypothetical protein
MTDTKYNGWTNYSTWRVNLEIFDGLDISEFDGINDKVDPELICPHTLAEALQERAEYYIFECDGHRYDERRPSSLMEDYARAFLSDVNWFEIAQHMISDFVEESKQ